MLAEDAFGLGLGQEQQVRVRGVGETEVEERRGRLAAASMHAQLDGSVAAFDKLRCDAESGQDFQGAWLDGQRPGLMGPVVAAVRSAGRTPCAANRRRG